MQLDELEVYEYYHSCHSKLECEWFDAICIKFGLHIFTCLPIKNECSLFKLYVIVQIEKW